MEKKYLEEITFKENFFKRLIYDFFWWLFLVGFLSVSFLLLANKKPVGILLLFVFFIYLLKKNNSFKEIPSRKEDIEKNLLDYFNLETKKILEKSYFDAKRKEKNFYLILLKELLKRKKIKRVLEGLEINPKKVLNEVEENLKKEEFVEPKKSLQETIFLSFKIAYFKKSEEVDVSDLFLFLLKSNLPYLNKIFLHFGITFDDFLAVSRIIKIKRKFKLKTISSLFAKRPKKIKIRHLNRSWTSKPTPFLDKFSIDLTSLASEGIIGFMIGHKEEYDRMLDILGRETKNNVLLEGKEGSGKETLVSFLAKEIIEDRVPKKLFDKRLVKLVLPWVFSGAKNLYEIEKRVKLILEEAIGAGNIILYLPEIQLLFGKDFSLIDAFLPYFGEKRLLFIGAIDTVHFKTISQRKDFLNFFEKISVKEISKKEALQILFLESILREKKYKIKISFWAIKKCVEFAKIYNPLKLLPQSAIELLDETIKESLDKEKEKITSKEVYEIVKRKTKIPVGEIEKKEKEVFLNLENLISQKLVDQKEAVRACARVLREYRAGLKPKKRPIACFLFVGPTGVGKTYLSKILAEILFGNQKFIIRFDMSKYQKPESVNKLIGDLENNIFGELSQAILKNPYSVILLDEFEKAHPKVLNLFLPIFDEGEIIDNFGYKLDFSHSLIIATSNANANFIVDSLRKGKTISEIETQFRQSLIKFFPPELLNRFSQIVLFKSLGEKEIYQICLLQLKELKKEMAKKGIIVKFSQSVVIQLSKEGFSKEFGARNLKRVIEKNIRSLLADWLIKNPPLPGTKILIDWDQKYFLKT